MNTETGSTSQQYVKKSDLLLRSVIKKGRIYMLNISRTREDSKLCVAVEGRLDTTTAPELEASLKEDLENVTDLVIDLSDLEYISSAGLRVLLAAQKTMMKQGNMVVTHPNEVISEIFEVTGFSDILTIEQ